MTKYANLGTFFNIALFHAVSLNHSNWCWKSTDISCVIVKGSQAPLRFIQTGYSMKYDVSHRIFMVSTLLVPFITVRIQ